MINIAYLFFYFMNMCPFIVYLKKDLTNLSIYLFLSFIFHSLGLLMFVFSQFVSFYADL